MSVNAAITINAQTQSGERESGLPTMLSEELMRDLARTLLSVHCAFSRRGLTEQHGFAEEYVLPQLLMEWANEHETLEGVRFASTRLPSLAPTVDEGYRMNLALIPTPRGKSEYDTNLLQRFQISEPMRVADARVVAPAQLKEATKQLAPRAKGNSLLRQAEYIGVAERWDSVPLSSGATYADHPLGKLQRQLLYDSLVRRI